MSRHCLKSLLKTGEEGQMTRQLEVRCQREALLQVKGVFFLSNPAETTAPKQIQA